MTTILIIDSNPAILHEGEKYLSQDTAMAIVPALSVDEALNALKNGNIDIIVANYALQGEGRSLINTLKERDIDVPVIFYARHPDEKTIIESIRSGAEFFLRLDSEPKAAFIELRGLIEEIVRRKGAELSLKRTVKDLRAIVTRNADAMVILDRDGYIQFANPAAKLLFNISGQELIGKLFGFPIILQEPVEMYILREFRKFIAVEMRMVEVEWKGLAIFSHLDAGRHVACPAGRRTHPGEGPPGGRGAVGQGRAAARQRVAACRGRRAPQG